MINTKIPIYGIAILISLITNIIIIINLIDKKKYTKDELIGLILYENIGIIFGSKFFTFLTNYNTYNGKFDFIKTGLSSYGAIIGAILFISLFAIQFKKSLKELLNIFIIPIPLMYAIGKVGCFLAGCCIGIPYNGIGHITYHYSTITSNNNIELFPIQIIETITFTLIFIHIIKIYSKNKEIISNTFILCGISKFILDFFRMSHIENIISTNQIISIIFIFIGISISKKVHSTKI